MIVTTAIQNPLVNRLGDFGVMAFHEKAGRSQGEFCS